MLVLFICASLLAVTTDVVQGKYVYRPKLHGWIAQHKIVSTWEEAYQKCRSEEYAILASPITEEFLTEMLSLISGETEYFIGTRAMYRTGPYVSIEGVLLDEMPAYNMIERLDPYDGLCLSISKKAVKAVPCSKRLPFMCYKREETESQSTECGTLIPGYKFDFSSGTCFKVHVEKMTWPQAYAECVTEGSHLAVFNDVTGANTVRNITFPRDTTELFVGLQDREGNGDWLSVFGERVEQLYNVWQSGSKPVSKMLRCGAVNASGKLLNISCDIERPFLCEREITNNRFPPTVYQQ